MIDKPGKGAFYATELEPMLRHRGIEALLVAGVTTEVCVHTTVREANDRGFRCAVLGDCLRVLRSPNSTRAALAMSQRAGRDFRLGHQHRARDRCARRAGGTAPGRVERASSRVRVRPPGRDLLSRIAGKGQGMTTTTAKPALWTPGDWNALFGFGTNILVNLLVLTGLLRFVLQIAAGDRVRAHPARRRADDGAVHLVLCVPGLSGWRRRTGRGRRSARCPRAFRVPHMFIVVLGDHAADRAARPATRSRGGKPG